MLEKQAPLPPNPRPPPPPLQVKGNNFSVYFLHAGNTQICVDFMQKDIHLFHHY